MKIIGAGLAGLLAANMLRHRDPMVIEKQATLPNNHSAVLRFRSSIISDVTGIEFKKVQVIKASLPWLNSVADSLAYSEKNAHMTRSDRSIPIESSSVERWIAPPDLIQQLAINAKVQYDTAIDDIFKEGVMISTIPMPVLMKLLGYPKALEFPSISGCNLRAKVSHCDAYASLYVPNPFYPFSRVSLMGNEIVAEIPFLNEADVMSIGYGALMCVAGKLLGIESDRITDIELRQQTYAKILPIDERERKSFIAWATDKHNIYSLGRYACWRPTLLLDDLVQDIRLIERWINGGKYARKLHQGKKETIFDKYDQDCIPGN